MPEALYELAEEWSTVSTRHNPMDSPDQSLACARLNIAPKEIVIRSQHYARKLEETTSLNSWEAFIRPNGDRGRSKSILIKGCYGRVSGLAVIETKKLFFMGLIGVQYKWCYCSASWQKVSINPTKSLVTAIASLVQGVQKVLNVRFHPEGLLQLVCGSNEIKAVDFAVRGASIVSCGSNMLKVAVSRRWFTGNCKMSKVKNMIFPLDVMEFCNENLLACGSDDEHGGSATVQLWDIESPQSFINFPANTSVLVMEQLACLIFARVMQLIICLLEQITRLHLFHLATVVHTFVPLALNSTLVWDTRLMPTNVQQMHLGKASEVRDMDLVRPLHCLSHGKQMPTAEHIGQLPGHVDEGDQGAMMLNETIMKIALRLLWHQMMSTCTGGDDQK
ncbi:hypothetical protein HPP92_011477 [Vanilla planifolia]|uniref:Uncharacterized protein n=1 Tax=Vanilla planifolia TaxID=51239 RepID=A0A835RBJ7_VANPL|nr:hypothetical protein HPP92_011477 [Vanilla planifolia]